ncbi:hypothetical protein ACS0PU_010385 [Formica fusca]
MEDIYERDEILIHKRYMSVNNLQEDTQSVISKVESINSSDSTICIQNDTLHDFTTDEEMDENTDSNKDKTSTCKRHMSDDTSQKDIESAIPVKIQRVKDSVLIADTETVVSKNDTGRSEDAVNVESKEVNMQNTQENKKNNENINIEDAVYVESKEVNMQSTQENKKNNENINIEDAVYLEKKEVNMQNTQENQENVENVNLTDEDIKISKDIRPNLKFSIMFVQELISNIEKKDGCDVTQTVENVSLTNNEDITTNKTTVISDHASLMSPKLEEDSANKKGVVNEALSSPITYASSKRSDTNTSDNNSSTDDDIISDVEVEIKIKPKSKSRVSKKFSLKALLSVVNTCICKNLNALKSKPDILGELFQMSFKTSSENSKHGNTINSEINEAKNMSKKSSDVNQGITAETASHIREVICNSSHTTKDNANHSSKQQQERGSQNDTIFDRDKNATQHHQEEKNKHVQSAEQEKMQMTSENGFESAKSASDLEKQLPKSSSQLSNINNSVPSASVPNVQAQSPYLGNAPGMPLPGMQHFRAQSSTMPPPGPNIDRSQSSRSTDNSSRLRQSVSNIRPCKVSSTSIPVPNSIPNPTINPQQSVANASYLQGQRMPNVSNVNNQQFFVNPGNALYTTASAVSASNINICIYPPTNQGNTNVSFTTGQKYSHIETRTTSSATAASAINMQQQNQTLYSQMPFYVNSRASYFLPSTTNQNINGMNQFIHNITQSKVCTIVNAPENITGNVGPGNPFVNLQMQTPLVPAEKSVPQYNNSVSNSVASQSACVHVQNILPNPSQQQQNLQQYLHQKLPSGTSASLTDLLSNNVSQNAQPSMPNKKMGIPETQIRDRMPNKTPFAKPQQNIHQGTPCIHNICVNAYECVHKVLQKSSGIFPKTPVSQEPSDSQNVSNTASQKGKWRLILPKPTSASSPPNEIMNPHFDLSFLTEIQKIMLKNQLKCYFEKYSFKQQDSQKSRLERKMLIFFYESLHNYLTKMIIENQMNQNHIEEKLQNDASRKASKIPNHQSKIKLFCKKTNETNENNSLCDKVRKKRSLKEKTDPNISLSSKSTTVESDLSMEAQNRESCLKSTSKSTIIEESSPETVDLREQNIDTPKHSNIPEENPIAETSCRISETKAQDNPEIPDFAPLNEIKIEEFLDVDDNLEVLDSASLNEIKKEKSSDMNENPDVYNFGWLNEIKEEKSLNMNNDFEILNSASLNEVKEGKSSDVNDNVEVHNFAWLNEMKEEKSLNMNNDFEILNSVSLNEIKGGKSSDVNDNLEGHNFAWLNEMKEEKSMNMNNDPEILNSASLNQIKEGMSSDVNDNLQVPDEMENRPCLRCKRKSIVYCQACLEAPYCSKRCSDLYWKAIHYKQCKNLYKLIICIDL